MELKYTFKSVDYCVDTILEFIKEGQTAFWSEPFYRFYPDIQRTRIESSELAERREYLIQYFRAFEQVNKNLLEEKLKKYNAHWNLHKNQIVASLENAFSLDLKDTFNDMRGYISFCPICPRYLDSCTFDIFYLNSEKGALGISIHEIIHFVWFYVWNKQFQDNTSEYDTPHLKWVLSEMVVDLIMRDKRLSSINPYFSDGCVYPYFYTMMLENKPILDTLNEMYISMNIHEFMEESYKFCLHWEKDIREHIKHSENMG